MDAPRRSAEPEAHPLSGYYVRVEDRLWNSYVVIDNRRRRGFYLLLTLTTAFGLLWATQPSSFKVPLLETNLDLFVAMALAPPLLLTFSCSYTYLCAHTIDAYMTYLAHFRQHFSQEQSNEKIPLLWYHMHFKHRDITERFNIFFFGTIPTRALYSSMPTAVFSGAFIAVKMVLVLLVVAPPFVYVGSTLWLATHHKPHVGGAVGWSLVAVYSLMATLFVAAPWYYCLRIKPARDAYKKMCLTQSRFDTDYIFPG